MKNKLFLVLIMILPGILLAQKARTFPYEISLTGTTKPSQIIEGKNQNAPTGTSRYTNNGIVLTTDQQNGFSGFGLNDIAFTSNFGLIVEFEYAMYGGRVWDGRYGDGMSFFLYDGSKAFSLGDSGAALGYSYRNDPRVSGYNPNVATINGVDGGYLGIGLDAYGNYKVKMNTGSTHIEGIPLHYNGLAFNGKGANHITLRGAVNPSNRKGYPVLISQQVSGVNENKIAKAMLNTSTGNYFYTQSLLSSSVNLRTTIGANDGKLSYNKIKVELIPKTVGEFTISVYITSNNKEVTVIKDYVYSKSVKAPDFNGNIYSLNTSIPSTFKLGFAASTGSATQFAIIRSIQVNLPFAPITKYDEEDICVSLFPINKGKKIVFNPFANDTFYTGTLTGTPTAGNSTSHIDANSFRFEDFYGNPIGTTGANASYTQAGVGTWSYNASTRLVTLTLSEDTYGVSSSTNLVKQIYYSVKGTSTGGGPFNNEYYRSAPTLMNIRFVMCPDEARINPNFSIENSN